MPSGKFCPEASVVIVPPSSGTFITLPLATLFVQYKLVESTAMPQAPYCSDASVTRHRTAEQDSPSASPPTALSVAPASTMSLAPPVPRPLHPPMAHPPMASATRARPRKSMVPTVATQLVAPRRWFGLRCKASVRAVLGADHASRALSAPRPNELPQRSTATSTFRVLVPGRKPGTAVAPCGTCREA